MKKSFISRTAAFAVSGITAVFFGFSGQASAATASITNTGPNSVNTISAHVTNNCTVTNNNAVQVNNSNHQTATTGDANVEGNTFGGDWGAWDPAVWKAQGHTYAEWHSAFMAYMASHEADWGNGWGGSATSGDASNHNSTNVHVGVNNDGGCVMPAGQTPGGQGGGHISGTGPDSHNAVLASSTTRMHVTNNNSVGASNSSSQGAVSGASTVQSNTSSGGAGSGMAGNDNGTHLGGSVSNGGPAATGPAGGNPGMPGSNATISNTGPNSSNKIMFSSNSSTTVTNDNDIHVTNINNQYAHSGDATVSGNTTGGSASTGDASNQNNTDTGVDVHN